MTTTIYTATFTHAGQTYHGSIYLDKGASAYRASLAWLVRDIAKTPSWESWEPVSEKAVATLRRRMFAAAKRRGWVALD